MAATDFEILWNDALRKQRNRLNGRKYIGLFHELQYSAFADGLEQLRVEYNQKLVTTCITKLRPIFEQFSLFERAISSACQAYANPCAIVWGVIQALLTCACSFLRTLDKITSILGNLTKKVLYLNEWTKLLPQKKELQDLTTEIVTKYVEACITVVKFYKRSPLLAAAQTFWSDAERPLKHCLSDVTALLNEFEATRRLGVDQELLLRVRNLHNEDYLEAKVPKQGIYKFPRRQNEFFSARDSELDEVRKQLDIGLVRPVRSFSCTLVHGSGGIGKTELALEYCHRFQDDYHCIWWISAEVPADVSIQLARVSDDLQLKGADTAGVVKKLEMARQWFLATDRKWLLVFDNVEDRKKVEAVMPHKNGSIIITSQLISMTHFARNEVPLEPLDDVDGARMLIGYMKKTKSATAEDREIAEQISHRIGGVPIAIAHIAGVCLDSQQTLQECLTMLDNEDWRGLWMPSEIPGAVKMYEKRLHMVWDMAYDELSNLARDALHVFTLLNPDRISEGMFIVDNPEEADTSLQKRLLSGSQRNELRQGLAKRQLAQRFEEANHQPFFTIHRSLQKTLRDKLRDRPDLFWKTFDEAVAIVRSVCPPQDEQQRPSNQNWAKYERYQPHIYALLGAYGEKPDGTLTPGMLPRLLCDASNYFWERSEIEEGAKMADQCVEMYEQYDDPDLMELADAYTMKSVLNNEKGVRGRGRGLDAQMRALKTRRRFVRVPPPGGTQTEQLLYANAWHDFGDGLLQMGDYAEASKYLRHAHDLKTRFITDHDDPQMHAVDWINLAFVSALDEPGNHNVADEYAEKAVYLAEKANGEGSAAALNHHFWWANCMILAERFEEARVKLSDVLERRRPVFGDHGLPTRDAEFGLAVAMEGLDAYEEAEELISACLDQLEEFPWSEERVARAYYWRSRLYEKQHRPGLASEWKERASKLKAEITDGLADFVPQHDDHDELQLYDHLVSLSAGRYVQGQSRLLRLQYEATDIDASIQALDAGDFEMPKHRESHKRHENA